MVLRGVRRFYRAPFGFNDIVTNIEQQAASNVNTRFEQYAKKLQLNEFHDLIIESQFNRPPTLKHNLDKILRTEGIYPVDQFCKLNKSKFVKKIITPTPEILQRFPKYTPPSQDAILRYSGQDINAKYVTGSSSITEALQHIFYTIMNFRSPNMTGLGKLYDSKNMNYMSAYRRPVIFMLRKIPGAQMYSIDGDGGLFEKNNQILMDLGKLMEGMLTIEEDKFLALTDTKKEPPQDVLRELQGADGSYRFRKLGNILVRSQIDAEGMGDDGDLFVFEIKTRATAPQRYDVKNIKDYLDYEITQREGLHSSYEREFFDLVRSLLIKYFFQIKMGRMDGAFIAYHNTEEIFAFEYITLKEIEKRLLGSEFFGDLVLKMCANLLQIILDDITSKFPDDEMIRIGFLAQYRYKDLLITVERFDKQTEWNENTYSNEFVTNEIDYYKLYDPNKTAYTMTLKLFPYLNAILQKEPVFLDQGDNLEIAYLLYYQGIMSFNEYMDFLHNAMKMESFIFNDEFSGGWKKFNDYHVYRKSIFNS